MTDLFFRRYLISQQNLKMKKIFFVFSLALCVATFQVNAQNMDYRSSAGLSVGGSFLGLVDNVFLLNDGVTGTSSNTPAIEVNYDYALKQWFSVGFRGGYQAGKMDLQNVPLTDDDGFITPADVQGNYARTVLALELLFHYGNAGKVDMYSGLRGGLSIWSGELNSTSPDLDLGVGSGTSPNIGLTVFGLRYYFTENIGAGFELSVGSPSYANVGVRARF